MVVRSRQKGQNHDLRYFITKFRFLFPNRWFILPSMLRAVKLTLELASDSKKQKIRALLGRYRSCVNRYIEIIWVHGGTLDKATHALVPSGHLSERQRAHALKQALAIISATRRSQKALGKKSNHPPKFKGSMTVSDAIAELTKATSGLFSHWLHLSTLRAYKRISIPVNATRVLDDWLSKPLARLKGGCTIGEDSKGVFAIVWVELPDLPPKEKGKKIGIDIGMNKLLATSDGEFLGEETGDVCDKVRRRKLGSKGKRRARIYRTQYFNEVVKQINFDNLKLIALEDLKGIKTGKKPNRGKRFRKIIAPWTATSVLRRIAAKAQENRVRCIQVEPRYTSQTCLMCEYKDAKNRNNEKFKCLKCGFEDDADHVGSVNILNKALDDIEADKEVDYKL
jgi:putative transposase